MTGMPGSMVRAAQLVDDRWREELGLVGEDAVDAVERSGRKFVIGFDKNIGGGGEARAGRDGVAAKAVVETRFEQEDALALLAVVVGNRQEIHGLGAVHGSITEVELGHAAHYTR